MTRDWAGRYFHTPGTVSTWWDPLAEEDPTFREWFVQQMDFVIRACRPKGRFIVDAATGRGRGAIACSLEGAAGVLALDISLEMLGLAQSNAQTAGCSTGISWVRGDVGRLPLKSCSADAVLLLETMLHLEAPEVALHECARVLRPGGILLVTTNGANPLARLVQPRRRGPHAVPRWKLAAATTVNEVMSLAFGFCWRRTSMTAALYRRFFSAPVRPLYPRQVRAMLIAAGFRAVRHYAAPGSLLPREHRWVALR